MCNEAQALEEKGIKKGIEIGIEIGRFIQLVELVKHDLLSIEEASQMANMPIDTFLIKMKDI